MQNPVLTLLIAVAAASPQVNFPLSSQLPPVAQVGKFYSFQFASTTFLPDPDKLQYTLVANPPWLSLDGQNRTLHGTPGPKDAGIATFTIAAAGEAGAVANMDSKLLVSDAEPMKRNTNISEVLVPAGQLSGPNTVIIRPLAPIDIKFPADMFQTVGKKWAYHALLADHTPLPSWISFDASSLHFNGTTPPLASSPQSYDILLIASEDPAFAIASIQFTLSISDHQLYFKPLQQTISITRGENVVISGLWSNLFLDGVLAVDADINLAAAHMPQWLSFDNHTFDITGSPPSKVVPQDIVVTVKDKYGDTANHTIQLLFVSDLFVEEIGLLNLTVGEYFNYTIPKSILRTKDELLTVDLGLLANWLIFDQNTLTIFGTVPDDGTPQNVEITLMAMSRDRKVTDSQPVRIAVSRSNSHLGPESSTTAAQPSGTSGATIMKQQAAEAKSKRDVVIAGSVVGVFFAILILLTIFLVCRRRRKPVKGYISPRTPRSPRKADISRPIMRIAELDDMGKALDEDMEKGKDDISSHEQTPEHPPPKTFDPYLERKHSHSPNSSVGEGGSELLEDFNKSPFGDAGSPHNPHDSMKIPTAIARRESEIPPIIPAKHHRRTTTVYRDPEHGSVRPLNRRISGLDHARHFHSPSRSNNNMSVCRPLSLESGTTRSTSILTAMPLPQLSAARHTTQLTTPLENRKSIRLVSRTSTSSSLVDRLTPNPKRRSFRRKSTQGSLTDHRTIEDKRQSYIRKRAEAPSPFFQAGSSRISSSSYKFPLTYSNDSDPPSQPAPSPLNSLVVEPGKDFHEELERVLPASLRIRKPSETPSVETPKFSPSRPRKVTTPRSYTSRYATPKTGTTSHDREEERYDQLGTSPSTSVQELKSSINNHLGKKVFDEAEISNSEYSDEEADIEDYDKRSTVKPGQFIPNPLNFSRKRTSKRDSKQDATRASEKDSRRISQRNPTPYSLALEHGGKENDSSMYSLTAPSPSVDTKATAKTTQHSRSIERPKTIATTAPRPPRVHSRTESRTTDRSSTQRTSVRSPQSRPLSNNVTHRPRHSRTKSRISVTEPERTLSRPQSSAFPRFNADKLRLSLTDPRKPVLELEDTSALPQKDTAHSMLEREISRNLTGYEAMNEHPTTAKLPSSPINKRTSNGKRNSSARHSHLTHLTTDLSHQSNRSSKRNTVIHPSTPTPTTTAAGLGLTLFSSTEGTPGPDSARSRHRTLLSRISDGNGATSSPARFLAVEGSGKKVDGDVKGGGTAKTRTTWGDSLKRVVSRGYGGYIGFWEGKDGEAKDGEAKAFI